MEKRDCVGQRFRLCRLRANKSPAEMAAILNMSSEGQYVDVELGKSPLERFGPLIGRLAVKYSVPVAQLLNTTDSEAIGLVVKKQRLLGSMSVVETCRAVCVVACDDDESEWLISEKEMVLIESGNHGTFERWLLVLKAFCLTCSCDLFTVVVGLYLYLILLHVVAYYGLRQFLFVFEKWRTRWQLWKLQ